MNCTHVKDCMHCMDCMYNNRSPLCSVFLLPQAVLIVYLFFPSLVRMAFSVLECEEVSSARTHLRTHLRTTGTCTHKTTKHTHATSFCLSASCQVCHDSWLHRDQHEPCWVGRHLDMVLLVRMKEHSPPYPPYFILPILSMWSFPIVSRCPCTLFALLKHVHRS